MNFYFCVYDIIGTGKTHTMEGDLSNPSQYGVIPRSAQFIFNGLDKSEYISHSVVVSYLEIYNEELCDLLSDEQCMGSSTHNNHAGTRSPSPTPFLHAGTRSPSPLLTKNKLEIMEGRDGVVCRGLTEKKVESAEDVLTIMKAAQKNRKIGETKMNLKSSRSHCVFTIRLSAQKKVGDGRIFDTRGKLHLVDLAGSECAKAANLEKKKKSQQRDVDEVNRDRGRERSNINRSLLTLGRVIIMLNKQSNTKKSMSARIPYRDSKLTRILQDSLGGKCKTLIIATLSPSEIAIEETMSTLNYAQSASGIVNKPVAVSYMKRSTEPRSGASTPIRNMIESKGIEHWYEMELKMEYLQSQLDEAQAALANHYADQREITDRAELAEQELSETKEKLKSSEKNLSKSITILKETKSIIVAQQDEIKNARIKQKHLKQQCVQQVLNGVNNLVNEQMNIMSTKGEKNLALVQERNHSIKTSIDKAESSGRNILSEIKASNKDIHEHSNECLLNDEKMKTNTKLTKATLADLDKLWNQQRQFVDNFVTQTNEKADMFASHEVAVATASTTLQNDNKDAQMFFADKMLNNMNKGMSQLSDYANTQGAFVRDTAFASTNNQLKEMENLRSNVMSDYCRTSDALFRSVTEGKENIEKVGGKQCDTADELRGDVEMKFSEYSNDIAKKRRSGIDARKEVIADSSDNFNKLTKGTLSSTTEYTSTAQTGAREFGIQTIDPWTNAPPVGKRNKIEYNSVLSSTPSDDIILQDLMKLTVAVNE